MEQQADQLDRIMEEIKPGPNDTTDTNTPATGHGKVKKEQFTSKQRLDMYAFCVLELEIHGNTVSVKKRQQAIKRLLSQGQLKQENQETRKVGQPEGGTSSQTTSANSTATATIAQNDSNNTVTETAPNTTTTNNSVTVTSPISSQSILCKHPVINQPGAKIVVLTEDMARQLKERGAIVQRIDEADVQVLTDDEKTLEQLQMEISSNLKCYSDYQRTQVLTSGMLKNVQKRFAKYYPNSAVPSRTTIKHVFEKCVAHGTVDNIKNPRKPSKITKGCEIEQLLEKEPNLSLRQLAARLSVSVGTISRRCKALGLTPESVTIKHQQLAIARRQKQIKQQGELTPTKMSPAKPGRPAKTSPKSGCKTRRQNGSGTPR